MCRLFCLPNIIMNNTLFNFFLVCVMKDSIRKGLATYKEAKSCEKGEVDTFVTTLIGYS